MGRRPLEGKRNIIKNYIRKNPTCIYRDIRRDTKLKVERYYKNMGEAYRDAGVKLSKNLTKRNRDEQKRDVTNFIRKNPGCTVTEIQDVTRVTIPRVFGSILNAYKMADVKYVKKEIKDGVRNPLVIKRYKKFEKRIIKLLEKLGKVKAQVRISSGIVDCLFNYNHETFVVEIKDYRSKKNITMSDIKQLIRYMKVLNHKKGLIICPKESFPKKKNTRNIYIENLSINILSEEDLRGEHVLIWHDDRLQHFLKKPIDGGSNPSVPIFCKT